jgi:RNA polymerase sigma factor (TIGR02999 family)
VADSSTNTGLAVLYQRLRAICAKRLGNERIEHTLQATALANEVWLRLFERNPAAASGADPTGRWFIRNAVVTIRHVLVDHARAKQRLKRGGGAPRGSIEPDQLEGEGIRSSEAVLLADELLSELSVASPLQSQIAQLRFFGGLTFAQIAMVTGLDEAMVRREWNFALLWLGSRPGTAGWLP